MSQVVARFMHLTKPSLYLRTRVYLQYKDLPLFQAEVRMCQKEIVKRVCINPRLHFAHGRMKTVLSTVILYQFYALVDLVFGVMALKFYIELELEQFQ